MKRRLRKDRNGFPSAPENESSRHFYANIIWAICLVLAPRTEASLRILARSSRGPQHVAKDLTRLSRAVSHALRHEPWQYELELDEDGWADVGALLVALRQESSSWSELVERDLAEMMRVSSKQRYEMVNGRIRA